MRDPIEFYHYPKNWVKRAAEKEGLKRVREKIESGLYILTKDGWIKRGITTATTASAAIVGAIASVKNECSYVRVSTPVGIEVSVKVKAEKGKCVAKKFAGDHAFDRTDGVEIVARVKDSEGIYFGKGIGVKNGKKAVSESAKKQIEENFRKAREKFEFEGGVEIEIPEGEKLCKITGNERVGIRGGISVLGSTGFVEPWCEKLVKTKAELVKQYDKVAITTGREGFRYALKNFSDFQPFVFGVYIDEALKNARGEVIIVGKPALLVKWAVPELRGKIIGDEDVSKYKRRVLKKAKELNENVEDVVLI